uniref:Uncharacterized protein LOC116306522 n=1 Tax=Actinia tenebrosa TaxID=6105 RepID=A0A6P8IYA2_ACTTE
MFSVCVCEEGFYGVNCSQDEPPLEPPVLEASSSGGIEDTSVPVFLSAHMVGINRTDDVTLSITIYGVPDSFVFTRGMRSKDQVTLLKQQFGDLFVTPAKDFSGNFTVDIVAQAARGREKTQTKSSFTINVKAKADIPNLITEDACANLTGLIPLPIKAWLNDNDGSEKLTITLSGLPNEYQLSRQGRLVNGTHYLETDSLTGLVARYDGVFEPFVLKVVATSVEKSNGDRASVMKIINVTSCILQWTCEKNCSDHGVCVAPDKCRCEEGYTEPDCSQDSTVNTNPGDAKNLAAIVGGSVGGVIFLLLLVALVAMALRAHQSKIDKNATARNVYNNPAYETYC